MLKAYEHEWTRYYRQFSTLVLYLHTYLPTWLMPNRPHEFNICLKIYGWIAISHWKSQVEKQMSSVYIDRFKKDNTKVISWYRDGIPAHHTLSPRRRVWVILCWAVKAELPDQPYFVYTQDMRTGQVLRHGPLTCDYRHVLASLSTDLMKSNNIKSAHLLYRDDTLLNFNLY